MRWLIGAALALGGCGTTFRVVQQQATSGWSASGYELRPLEILAAPATKADEWDRYRQLLADAYVDEAARVLPVAKGGAQDGAVVVQATLTAIRREWDGWNLDDDLLTVTVVFREASGTGRELYKGELEVHGAGSRLSSFGGRMEDAMENLAAAIGQIARRGRLQ